MRKLPIVVIMAVLLTLPVVAAGGDVKTNEERVISLSSKVPIGFYGFISAEGLYADSQLSSFGTLNNDVASYNRNIVAFNRVVDEKVAGEGDAFLSWTVQNTRFGFLFSPYDFGGRSFKIDARLEMDFWSTSNMSISSVVPRIRRAYAGIGQERWHLLFGQEWDVYSPLNTGTLNVGNDLWRQGNLGFRRPQMRFTYNCPIGGGRLEMAASVNIPSNVMNADDSGNDTGIPMFESSLGYLKTVRAGQVRAYISAAYARHNNEVVGQSDVNNWGIAASLSLPIHKYLQPSGEFHYGYSLGMMLTEASDTRRQRFIAGWGQVKSEWTDWLETNAGYGLDTIDNVQENWVRKNQLVYANLKFKPVSSFVVGFEYNYMMTTYKGSGSSEANVGFMNVMYIF